MEEGGRVLEVLTSWHLIKGPAASSLLSKSILRILILAVSGKSKSKGVVLCFFFIFYSTFALCLSAFQQPNFKRVDESMKRKHNSKQRNIAIEAFLQCVIDYRMSKEGLCFRTVKKKKSNSQEISWNGEAIWEQGQPNSSEINNRFCVTVNRLMAHRKSNTALEL